MHRIDSDGSVEGRYHSGNPQNGQRATMLSADWFNDIQENVCRVIEYTGQDLKKGNYNQLRDALVQLIAGVVGDGGGSVPTTRRIDTLGLLGGGGPLAANLVFEVQKATAAEVSAGTIDYKAVTPYGLAGAFASVMAPTGYFSLPFSGGGFVQWFTVAIPGNATTILTLPYAYTEACFGAWVNGGAVGYDMQDNPPFVSGKGTANVSVHNDLNATTSITIWAVGK